MLDTILEEIKKIAKSRLFPVTIVFTLLFCALVYRLFTLQVVNGEEYEESTESDYNKTIETKATRGNIYDSEGRLLAYNELSYSLQISNSSDLNTSAKKNEMISSLIKIVEAYDGELNYDFPISLKKSGDAQFTEEESSIKKFKMNVFSLSSVKDLTEEQLDMTAEDLFTYMQETLFKIDESYSKKETLKIMSIRYILYMNRYNKNSATIATDISEDLVTVIKENRDILLGVEIVEETNRVYKYSEYFAQILGYTGIVSTDTIEDDDYYTSTDQIGKTGLEEQYEDYLRGEKGYQKVTVNSSGEVISVNETKDAVAGNDLYLTIDAELQKASYKLLEKHIAGILIDSIVNSTSTGSKGTSADDITIPIYDVYFALLDNNIINIDEFSDSNASSLEQSVYSKFQSKQSSVFSDLKSQLAYNHTIDVDTLSDETSDYFSEIYTVLKDNDILLSDEIDTDDQTYKDYKNGNIGLNEFLEYALENYWIDTSVLDLEEGSYYNTEELYSKLLDYTFELLQDDTDFSKRIYYYMIYNYNSSYALSGKEVGLLLYDQGVLKDDDDKSDLENSVISSYSFMIRKIKALEITPAMLALKPCSGSVVITDPDTGEVRACVSYPGYDNNKLANTVDSTYYAQLISDQSFPLINRATKQLIAPGSTFKTFSATMALENGTITPYQTIYDEVTFKSIVPSPSCWSTHSHGSINVSDAIGVSCNYFFYQVGYWMSKDANGNYVSNLGLKKIQEYAKKYGMDAKSGIELSEDSPTISTEDAVRSMIGQGGTTMAPVQLSRWVTTIANEGTSYNLTLIDKIEDTDGNVILDNQAEVYKELDVSSSTWAAVKLGMYKVVNGASSSISSSFSDLDVTVAGKTGTSQISKSVPNNALFISYAPYDDPEITLTVVIPNGYTSHNAANVASDIYKYYFDKDSADDLLSGGAESSGDSNSVTD